MTPNSKKKAKELNKKHTPLHRIGLDWIGEKNNDLCACVEKRKRTWLRTDYFITKTQYVLILNYVTSFLLA